MIIKNKNNGTYSVLPVKGVSIRFHSFTVGRENNVAWERVITTY